MIGISWRREQGLADPLLKRLVEEAGLENVPQWTKVDDVRMRAHAKWMAMVDDRDGATSSDPRDVSDSAAITAEIKDKARGLGADLVGVCELTPIMIDQDFDMPHRSVVAIVVHEEYANALQGSRAIEAETYDVYVRVARIATELSAYIRDMGFPAWAHHNGVTQMQAIPTMYQCGFGELGRNGSLINPTYSANFRPSFVTTDLPLDYDSPLVYGVQEYCENCNLCRNNCPGEAVATDHILTEGIKRWRIDMEKCYPYSRLHEAYCHICVDVCPYVQKENRDPENKRMYKAFMKQRRDDGYRSPNRL
jgi:ferredoxin